MSRRLTHALTLAAALALTACGAEAPPSDPARDASVHDDTSAEVADDTSDPGDAFADLDAPDATPDAAASDTAADAPPPDLDADPVPAPPLGGDRPAAVTLPAHYDPARPWPLVVLLHGYSANGFLQDVYLGFSARATAHQFIAVVPEGTTAPDGKQFWNATAACCDFYDSDVDDVAYLLSLIDEVRATYNVDPARVAVLGHSNGGFMAYELACRAPAAITAIASIAGGDAKTPAVCEAGPAVSVLQVHGTADTTVPYTGSATFPSAETSVQHWVTRNACAPTPLAEPPRDYDDGVPGAETTPQRWPDCRDAASVALWTMLDTGHIPPFTPAFMDDALGWLLTHARPQP